MLFLSRAASLAAVTLIAAILGGTTTPSFAGEIDHRSIASTTLNALTAPAVPPLTPAIVANDPVAPAAPLKIQTVPQLQPAVVTEVAATPLPVEDETDFDSLAEAVAAQDADDADRELTCLAAGVYFESKGEPLAGQLAVAQTILNRAKSGRFPPSVCAVLTQRGQFSFVRGGAVPTGTGRAGWKTAVAVAKVAAADLWDSVAPRALYFHARRVSPSWRMAKVAAIGNHVFYR